MKIKSKFILIAALALGCLIPPTAEAIEIRVELGDRPYYTHGARYWHNDYEYIWVPGYRKGRRWVHGHYRRGKHRHDRWHNRGRHRHRDRGHDRDHR